MELDELRRILSENGVAGAGGAGFPSYRKLDARTDTLILNCAECEPLLKLHKQLLTAHTREILDAFQVIGETVGAARLVVAVKSSSKSAAEAVSAYSKSGVELFLLPDVYPAGDEVVLTYEVTGKTVQPGALPISVGVTVYNVETVYNVSRALKGEPVTHKYVTVSGEVKLPVTLRVPLGTTVTDLLRLAGGASVDAPVFIMGGPMMGSVVGGDTPVTKTTNGVLVLENSHPLVRRSQSDLSVDLKRAQAACCQCSYCTDMCPRHLLGHPVEPGRFMLRASNFSSSDTDAYLGALYCSGCGVCEVYACQQGLSPRKLLFAMRQGLKDGGVAPVAPEKPVQPDPMRAYRLVPTNRLKARLGVERYDKTPRFCETEPDIKTVRVLLRQHIGAPAVPCVEAGGKVTVGQCVGKAPENALSVNVHASIAGTVISVSDTEIIISHEGGGRIE